MEHLKLLASLMAVVTIISSVPLDGSVVSQLGDVAVYINETVWMCDKIECPPDTEYCRITKQKISPDAPYLTRSNICYSAYNSELRRDDTYESISPDTRVFVNIIASRFGITSQAQGSSFHGDSSFVSAGYEIDHQKLLENINQIHTRVQKELTVVNRHIKEQINNALKEWV